MEILLAGTQEEQNPGHEEVDFPEGYGQWAFMLFYTPVRARTPDGISTGETGSLLINAPDYPMWHAGVGGPFRNDWFHCVDDGLEEKLQALEIPVNRLLRLPSEQNLIRFFRKITMEWTLKAPFRHEACTYWLNLLLIEIARQNRESSVGGPHLERLKELRLLIRDNPGHSWRIDDLARLVNLSPSRFSHLFKEYFHVSPGEDLLQCRLDQAKKLLVQTSRPVREIASLCGFQDERYFSRYFKRREGITPGEFRKRGMGNLEIHLLDRFC